MSQSSENGMSSQEDTIEAASPSGQEQFQEKKIRLSKTNKLLIVLLVVLLLMVIAILFVMLNRQSENIQDLAYNSQRYPSEEEVVVNDNQDLPITRLLTEDLTDQPENQIWVDAFSPWMEINLPDFKMEVPDCQNQKDCRLFSLGAELEEKSGLLGGDNDIYYDRVGSGYFVSKYYDSVFQSQLNHSTPRNDMNLVGYLGVLKITTPANLTTEEFIDLLNNTGGYIKQCKRGEEGYKMEYGYSESIPLKNKYVKVAHYVTDACYPPDYSGPSRQWSYYVMEYEGNIYLFEGAQEPLPKSVMIKIFESIKP